MAEDLDQVKEFDLKETSWIINGKKYYLLSKMPPRRYVEYLKLVPELVFNTTFAGMYETLHKIWTNCSTGNDMLGALHSTTELAYNQIQSIVDFDQREHPKVLQFCAIILYREGEDISEYDENLAAEKINDFMSDTYSMDSFFFLAMLSVQGFVERYNALKKQTNQAMTEAMQSQE